jgi:hypothetical protein
LGSDTPVPRDELLATYAANRHKSELIILGTISTIVVTEIGHLFPFAWVNIFLIILSWTVSDVSVEAFLIKRRGVIRVPIIGWTITRRSCAVVAYLIGIVVGSLLGNVVSQIILDAVSTQDLRASGTGLIFMVGSIFMFVLVYYDLRFRTDRQEKRN